MTVYFLFPCGNKFIEAVTPVMVPISKEVRRSSRLSLASLPLLLGILYIYYYTYYILFE